MEVYFFGLRRALRIAWSWAVTLRDFISIILAGFMYGTLASSHRPQYALEVLIIAST